MDRQAVIWLIIGIYAVVMVLIGLNSRKSAKNVSEFTVGKRGAGGWVSALSYGTAYFSAVMFIGYAGNIGWSFGGWAVAVGVGNAVFGALLAWLVLANRTRDITHRHEIKSMPQLFDTRFNSKPMKLFAAATIFIFLLPYSASVYKGLTSICAVLLGADPTVCMLVIAVLAAVLITLSGYIGTLKADFIQGMIMFVGVILMIIWVVNSKTVGGLTKGIESISKVTSDLGLTFNNHVGLWATVLMTSFGTWGLPHMIHKYYGIKDKTEVRRGTVISFIFAAVVGAGGYFIGSLGHVYFGNELPLNAAGVADKDYIIPNLLDKSNLPDVLLGLVLLVLLAASVTTLSALTLSASSTFSMDLIKGHFKKDISDKKLKLITQALCLVFIVFSYIIANTDTLILDMMSYSWGILSGAFLAPYLITLYWRGLNKAGAWAGMLGGFLTAMPPVIAKLFANGWMAPFDLGPMMLQGPVFAVAAMVVSFTLCIVVSLITGGNSKKSREKLSYFYEDSTQAAEQ